LFTYFLFAQGENGGIFTAGSVQTCPVRPAAAVFAASASVAVTYGTRTGTPKFRE
jgi:hypothetical protein